MIEVGNQLGSYPRHEQKRIHGVSDTKSEKNMDFNSSRNEADAMLHAKMAQVFFVNGLLASNTNADQCIHI